MAGMDTLPDMAFTICTSGVVYHLIQNAQKTYSDQIEDSAHEILLSSSVTPIVTFNSIKEVTIEEVRCLVSGFRLIFKTVFT